MLKKRLFSFFAFCFIGPIFTTPEQAKSLILKLYRNVVRQVLKKPVVANGVSYQPFCQEYYQAGLELLSSLEQMQPNEFDQVFDVQLAKSFFQVEQEEFGKALAEKGKGLPPEDAETIAIGIEVHKKTMPIFVKDVAKNIGLTQHLNNEPVQWICEIIKNLDSHIRKKATMTS